MIHSFLNRWAAKRLAGARQDRRATERQAVKAKAQSMRLAMGMPEHPALSTKGN